MNKINSISVTIQIVKYNILRIKESQKDCEKSHQEDCTINFHGDTKKKPSLLWWIPILGQIHMHEIKRQ